MIILIIEHMVLKKYKDSNVHMTSLIHYLLTPTLISCMACSLLSTLGARCRGDSREASFQ